MYDRNMMIIKKILWLFFILFFITACVGSKSDLDVTPGSTATNEKNPASAILPATQSPQSNATPVIWRPSIGSTWQWQLTALPVDLSVDAQVYDIDLFENDASVVAALHARGRKVICYLSAGTWEDWRPDKDQFPREVIGREYEGWQGERWLDIRRIELLAPVMRSRLDLCKQKGFDAVEPDNLDGYDNETGFPLTVSDQLRYNQWLANEAHQRGLSIGLKNDPDQATQLEPYFDWALAEDCFTEDWYGQMLPFIKAGKAVFAAEYSDTGVSLVDVCRQAQSLHFSVIHKNRDLDAYRKTCP